MALVHDMAEAITTDLTPESGYSAAQKHQLELDAMDEIERILKANAFGSEAKELWLEYARDSTKEAHFVKDLDKLELIIQICEYKKGKKNGCDSIGKLSLFCAFCRN
jgi:putative hydrolase of HD superfamily